MATVKPRLLGFSEKVVLKPAVAPAITAVSKPNSSPPSAATTVLLRSDPVSVTRAPANRSQNPFCYMQIQPAAAQPRMPASFPSFGA